MIKELFKEKVIATLTDFYGKDAEVIDHEVEKNNGVTRMGIIVSFGDGKDNGVSPIIYLDEYYEDYISEKNTFDEVIERIINVVDKNKCPDYCKDVLTNIMDYEFVKANVYPILLNTERNQKQLKDLVSREYLDLSIIYAVRIDSGRNGIASVKVTHKLLETIGGNEQELYMAAVNNLKKDKYNLVSMTQILKGLIDDEIFTEDDMRDGPQMFVLNSEQNLYSAAGVLDNEFMASICNKKDYYMLPSSVHEWILIPYDETIDANDLIQMVKEVNSTQLAEEEILSDNVYYYDCTNMRMAMVIATEL